jgi:hypothetical protein
MYGLKPHSCEHMLADLSYNDIARYMEDRRGIDPREWEALLLEGDWS